MEVACEETVDHLIDIMEGAGPAHLAAHAHECPTCQRTMQDMRTMMDAVHALPRVALPAEFESRLTDALLRRAPMPERAPWWRVFAGGLALAAAVAAVVVYVRMPAEPHVVMGLAQRVEVDIAVDSAAALGAVDMHITLPQGVSVASADEALDGAHSLQWTTALTAGVNHFPVLLKPDVPGAHRVHVAISQGVNAADMDVVVQVQPEEHAANARTRPLPVLALRDARGER